MILNVRHSAIVVRDLEAIIAFYQKLGFIESKRDTETGAFIEQVTGITDVKVEWIKMRSPDGFLLELLQYHSHPEHKDIIRQASNQLGCSHIAFTVADINKACELISEWGGSCVNTAATSSDGNAKVAYCHDPEGVLLEIVQEL